MRRGRKGGSKEGGILAEGPEGEMEKPGETRWTQRLGGGGRGRERRREEGRGQGAAWLRS